MNHYCESALHQIKVALDSILSITEQLTEEELSIRPSPGKQSIQEQLEHLATICKADLLIAGGCGQEEMDRFYSSVQFRNLEDIQKAILGNFELLSEAYKGFSERELEVEISSYWGATYTRFEWLLQIVAHIYHHRGQLHAQLAYGMSKELRVSLFE